MTRNRYPSRRPGEDYFVIYPGGEQSAPMTKSEAEDYKKMFGGSIHKISDPYDGVIFHGRALLVGTAGGFLLGLVIMYCFLVILGYLP